MGGAPNRRLPKQSHFQKQPSDGVTPAASRSNCGDKIMSLGFILVIVLIVFLLGGFSGRFGGYGYGFGHGGIGVLGTVLIIVVVLMLLGRI